MCVCLTFEFNTDLLFIVQIANLECGSPDPACQIHETGLIVRYIVWLSLVKLLPNSRPRPGWYYNHTK